MNDDLRIALTAIAVGLYGVFALFAIRSAHYSRRVAIQWDNAAGDHWRIGKASLVIGIIGIFFTTQQAEPLPLPWRPILFFAFLGALIGGEWQMGSGFKDVANAQDRWHRRNFSNGEE